mmetsp:Transcript_26654/g.76987  ORF Transcript_26654/g.76987 Transcript_26654/m.76987 type:complete len:210 (+) Transcript_26654:397-1026(+)
MDVRMLLHKLLAMRRRVAVGRAIPLAGRDARHDRDLGLPRRPVLPLHLLVDALALGHRRVVELGAASMLHFRLPLPQEVPGRAKSRCQKRGKRGRNHIAWRSDRRKPQQHPSVGALRGPRRLRWPRYRRRGASARSAEASAPDAARRGAMCHQRRPRDHPQGAPAILAEVVRRVRLRARCLRRAGRRHAGRQNRGRGCHLCRSAAMSRS